MSMQLVKGNWLDCNYQAIEDLLNSTDQGLAVFDFDNTMIYNDLGEACMYYIVMQGLIPGHREEFWTALDNVSKLSKPIPELKRYYNKFKETEDRQTLQKIITIIFDSYQQVYQTQGMEAAYKWSSLIFAYHKIHEWEKISRHVLADQEQMKTGVTRIGPGLELNQGIRKYTEIYNLIQIMLQKKWTVLIVTASPREIIAAVSDQWGIAPVNVIGMKLARNQVDEYLPEIIEPMPFDQGKLDILYDFLGNKADIDFAAGDSLGDRALLKAAKKSVLIDRGFGDMRKMAKNHNIMIQPRFINPLHA